MYAFVRARVDFRAHPVYARGWVVPSIEHQCFGRSVRVSPYLSISMESPSPFVFDGRHCPGRKRAGGRRAGGREGEKKGGGMVSVHSLVGAR